MASSHLPNYLKAHRKRLALFQDEVAYLLGVESGTQTSRYERFSRIPGLETVLAYEAIFGQPAAELFAGLYKEVQKRVAARAKTLYRNVASRPPTAQNLRKRQSLEQIMAGHGKSTAKKL